MAKSSYWPVGTILKDPNGRWWKVVERHFLTMCESYYKMESLDRKANGDIVLVNHSFDYVALCMESVTQTEMVLFGNTFRE